MSGRGQSRGAARGRGGGGGGAGGRGGGGGGSTGGRGGGGGGYQGGGSGGGSRDRGGYQAGPRGGGGGIFDGQYRGGGGASRGGGGGRGGFQQVEVYSDPKGGVPKPDLAVTKIEDDFIQQSGGIGSLSSLSLTTSFPRRPGHGTQGRPITVYANYFEVTSKANLTYYRYHVDVASEGKALKASKLKTKRLIVLLQEFPDFAGILTDYRSTILSINKLQKIPREIVIPFRGEGEDEPRENPARYKITIQETGTVLVSKLLDYLKSTKADESVFVQKQDVIQALNTVVGHFPQLRSDIATLGQNKHFSIAQNDQNNYNLGGGLQALRGYFKSIRPATGRILLNVNVSHAVAFNAVRLDELINQLNIWDYGPLAKQLKRLRLQRLHLPARKNKAGQVIPSVVTFWDFATTNDGQAEEKQPQVLKYGAGPKDVKFFLQDSGPVTGAKTTPKSAGKGRPGQPGGGGRYISVWDYFTNNYPQIKMHNDFAVINVGNRQNPRYLPVEACQVLPGQAVGKKLSPEQTRAMIQFACRRPKLNADSITKDGRKVLGLDAPGNAGLSKNGLSVGASLITVPARVLGVPAIKYQGTGAVVPRDGSWNMDRIKFCRGSTITNWTYIWVRSSTVRNQPGEDEIRDSVRAFAEFMNKTGVNIKFNEKAPHPGCDVNPKDSYQTIDKVIKNCLRTCNDYRPRPQFLLVILSQNDAAIYGKIKTVADILAGMHTVCVIGSKFVKQQRQEQYFANVALKFNLKAGGINQTLEPAKLGIISEGNTMVVGIDVTHPSPQSRGNAPSVAGIVASIDRVLGQWPAALSVQESRKEMVSNLQDMFKSRLLLWRKHNKGALPENVLIYRDGVSEGQYQIVLEKELPLLRAACKEVYPANKEPALSIIVVGKRHHTRFYPTQVGEADKSANCRNATVVDRGVTEVRFWHFYLQAHACLQGTARPAHYYVILDEIFRGRRPKNPNHRHAADALEDLTHNMCHLFGRATKAVSICPPAYYADLVCERARCYLSQLFDPSDDVPPSSAGSQKGGDDAPDDSAVKINDALKDTMFYI